MPPSTTFAPRRRYAPRAPAGAACSAHASVTCRCSRSGSTNGIATVGRDLQSSGHVSPSNAGIPTYAAHPLPRVSVRVSPGGHRCAPAVPGGTRKYMYRRPDSSRTMGPAWKSVYVISRYATSSASTPAIRTASKCTPACRNAWPEAGTQEGAVSSGLGKFMRPACKLRFTVTSATRRSCRGVYLGKWTVNSVNNGKRPSKGPAGAAVAFGRLLKFHRERAGVTMEALGKHTSYSKSQVAMVEKGERRPKERFVELADALLGAQGALKAVAETITASSVPAWWEDYMEEEKKAAGIHMFSTDVIPGLLQSPRYAEAVFACHIPAWDEEQAEALVAERMARQDVYNRKPRPIITYVLEKTCLTRPIGGREVLKDCLTHLLDIARLPNVTVQVMPEDREIHAGLNGPFVLLETAERQGQLGYVEGQSGRYFISEQPALGDMFMRYSTLRAQALPPEASVQFIEEVAQGL
ncbi:hypothetical protein SUDANB99_02512 [Streptomyces sp. enrichment culture]